MATAIYLRTSPTKSSRAKRVIPENGKVTIIKRYNNRWYLVRYKGTLGYIAAGYFKVDNPKVTSKRTVRTTVFIRSSMSTASRANVVAWVPTGKQVTVLSRINSKWYHVSYGSKSGYMKAGYFY